MPHAHSIVLIALLAACGGGGKGAGAIDGRLNGEWEIVLVRVPGTFGREGLKDTTVARGTLAFVPNRAGTRVPSFGSVPQQVGTHNLRLDRLVPDVNPRTAVPMAAGSSAGDSVRLVLDPVSGEPIVLRGTWQGSQVTGEWMAHRRTGIDQEGRFSLRRRSP